MKEKFIVDVDGNYQFELHIDDALDLDQLEFSSKEDHQKKHIHVLHNHQSYAAEILQADFIKREYVVKINGNTHKIQLQSPLAQLIKNMGLSLGNTSVEDEVPAPMPGIILEVNVKEGDTVKKGDFLCVLEAMKMENALTAPRDGIIKTVNIAKGDTVEKGKLLIELQKND